MNLAAFEMVDYVVIDKNAKPIENIRVIQPDYFAKGYEYTASGMPIRRPQEEMDVARSPTAARSSSRPATSSIRPRQLIETGAADDRAREAADADGARAASTSTICARTLDSHDGHARFTSSATRSSTAYTHCAMIGGMTKTPTMSVRSSSQRRLSSAAPAIVAKHLRGGRRRGHVLDRARATTAAGVRPRRSDGCRRQSACRSSTAPGRRPTRTPSSSGGYRLLKVDTLDNRSISDQMLEDDHRADREGADRCGRVQRFPPRHLQPPHDSRAGRRRCPRAASGSPTARSQAAGATSSTSRASI